MFSDFDDSIDSRACMPRAVFVSLTLRLRECESVRESETESSPDGDAVLQLCIQLYMW